MHGTKGDIKARESRLGSTRSPQTPTLVGRPKWPILPILASRPHMATPWRQDAGESEGTGLHSAFREFVLEGHRVGCFTPALMRPDRGSILDFLSQSQVGLKQPTFSPQLLGDIGGAISPEGSWDEPSGEHREPLSVGSGAHWLPRTRPWLVGTLLPWQGSRVNCGRVRGLCLTPRTCVPLRRWDLGLEYGLGLSVYCPEAPLPQSIA